MRAVMGLDLKRICKNKGTVVALIIALFFFFLLSGNLGHASAERSSVPIGIVDHDRSEMSKQLLAGLKERDSLFLYEKTPDELDQLLREEMIAAWFDIKDGYEEQLRLGHTQGLVTVHYLDSNRLSVIISDIVAGEFMYDVCLSKSYALYRNLGKYGDLISEEDYRSRTGEIRNNEEFRFGFEIEMISRGEQLNKQPENALLYQQVITGCLGTVLSFLIMALIGAVWDRRQDPRARRQRITIRYRAAVPAHLAVLALGTAVFCLISGLFFCSNFEISSIVSLLRLIGMEFMAGMLYVFVFAIIRECTGNFAAYQMYSGIYVITAGGGGILGFFIKDLLIFSKLTPNYWFIKAFTDIMVNAV